MMEQTNNIFPLEDHKKKRYVVPISFSKSSNFPKHKVKQLGYTKDKDSYKFEGGETLMDSKEYIDLRINALEENMNYKFKSQGDLFSEKLNTLTTKVDGQHDILVAKIDSISAIIKKDIEIISQQKVDSLKIALEDQGEENKKFTWKVVGLAVALATLVATVIPLFF